MSTDPESVTFRHRVVKAAPTGEFVRGWASVATVNGIPVEDDDADTVDIGTLATAAHRFISDHRRADLLHKGVKIGEIVESVIVDDEFAAALNATTPIRGWWIGMQIHSEAVRKMVRAGLLPAFSIGGTAHRIPEDDA